MTQSHGDGAHELAFSVYSISNVAVHWSKTVRQGAGQSVYLLRVYTMINDREKGFSCSSARFLEFAELPQADLQENRSFSP